MTVEFARDVAGLDKANSTEFEASSRHPVIDLMHDQREVTDLGGTMRLGAYYAVLTPGSKVHESYGEPVVSERHRHRYEFNPAYRSRLEEAGLVCSGVSPDRRLVEFISEDVDVQVAVAGVAVTDGPEAMLGTEGLDVV